jgi:hypothetical protein
MYRAPNPPLILSVEFFQKLQTALRLPAGVSALTEAGISALDAHEALNNSSYLLVALGDAMEAEWEQSAGIGACMRCGSQRWHLTGEEKDGHCARECSDCKNQWTVRPYPRDAGVQGRLQTYRGQDLSR